MKKKFLLLLLFLGAVSLTKLIPVKVKAASDTWKKIYNFKTTTSFRAKTAVLGDKLYLLAKDSYQEDDNKGGKINVFIYDGGSWQNKELPSCVDETGESMAIGFFSDLIEAKGKLFFGTYPRTSFMSYDGRTCRSILNFSWGEGSIWQTASRGVLYKGKIYFVSNKLVGAGENKGKQTSQLRAFVPGIGYPSVQKLSESYQVADGRDPTQGPLIVFEDKLYFTHGIFKNGGFLGVSSGGLSTKLGNSPNMNFYVAAVNKGQGEMYLAGWNEENSETGIYSFDSQSFKEIKTISGRFRPTAMAIFGKKLLIVGSEPEEQPIMTFNLSDSGKMVFEKTDGDSNYEVTDLEIYKGNLYALTHQKNSPENGEIWIFGEEASGPTIKGDLNSDGKVNLLDVGIYFLYKNVPLLGKQVAADLNGDGEVNSLDFKILQENF